MSVPNLNWNYGGFDDIDIKVKKIIFSHYIKSTNKVITDLEDDMINKDPILFRSEYNIDNNLNDILFEGATIQDLRLILGRMKNAIEENLSKQKATWDILWNDNIQKKMPQNVHLAMDIAIESIHRTHERSMNIFKLRWDFLNTKRRGEKWDNPLDINSLLKIYYNSQIEVGMRPPLQAMVFFQLEQELLNSLNFLLFDINNLLSEKGIRTDLDMYEGEGKVENNKIKIQNEESNSLNSDNSTPAINDEVLFNSLCELLETWEPSNIVDESIELYKDEDIFTKKILSEDEIFSSISTLQRWVPKVLEDALGQPDGRLGKHIKESLIKQAESLGAPLGETAIGENEEMAVDVVDEVFTKKLYKRKMQKASRSILAQILFPSVKAAILNRNWFSQESHPARKFINEMTDACSPEEGEPQEETLNKASQAVDKLISGFNEDVSIFQELAKEIHRFVEEKKQEIQNKIIQDEKIKKSIQKELEDKWRNRQAPTPVKDFALYLGVEYLFMLEKEHLRATSKWDSSISTLEHLMLLRPKGKERIQIDGILRDGLIQMLTHCGWTGVRAHGKLAEQEDYIYDYFVLGKTKFDNKYFDLQKNLDNEIEKNKRKKEEEERFDFDVPLDDSLSDTKDNTLLNIENNYTENENFKIQGDKKNNLDNVSDANIENEKVDNEKIDQFIENFNNTKQVIEKKINIEEENAGKNTDKDKNIIIKIENLNIGQLSTWMSDEGEAIVVKLSWISPISMKYLFVNTKGERVLVANPDELHDYVKKGRFFPDVIPSK